MGAVPGAFVSNPICPEIHCNFRFMFLRHYEPLHFNTFTISLFNGEVVNTIAELESS